jgi:hypothetical protein
VRERRKQAGASHIGHIKGSIPSTDFQHKHLSIISYLSVDQHALQLCHGMQDNNYIIIINNHPGPTSGKIFIYITLAIFKYMYWQQDLLVLKFGMLCLLRIEIGTALDSQTQRDSESLPGLLSVVT